MNAGSDRPGSNEEEAKPSAPTGQSLWREISQAANREVLIACCGGFLCISAVSVVGPVLGLIRSDFNVGYGMIGLVSSLFGFARLIVDLPAGWLAGRLNVRLLAAAGLVLMGLGALVAAMAHSYPWLLAGRVVMGLGQSVTSTATLTWVAQSAPPALRTTAFALFQGSTVAGLSFFPLASGLMGGPFGWRGSLMLSAAAAIGGVALIWATFGSAPRSKPVPGRQPATLRPPAKPSGRQLLGLAGAYAATFLLFFTSVGLIGTLAPLFGHDVLGLTPATIGAALALASLVGLGLTLPSGVWADRYGWLRVMVPGLAAIAVGSLAFLLARSGAGFIAAAAIVGLYAAAASVPTAIIAEIVPPSQQGTAMGLYRVAGDLGVLVGPWLLTAAVGAWGYGASILLCAGVAVATTAAAWTCVRQISVKPALSGAA